MCPITELRMYVPYEMNSIVLTNIMDTTKGYVTIRMHAIIHIPTHALASPTVPCKPNTPFIPVMLQQLPIVHGYVDLVPHQPNEHCALSKMNHRDLTGQERGLNQQETG